MRNAGYVAKGLGPTAGVISGWALVLAYLGAAMANLGGFALYSNLVLGSFSFHVWPIFLYVICAGIAWFYCYTDIQLSAVIMLILEISAASLILILGALVLLGHGFTIDTKQFSLEGVSFEGIRLGLVLAVFSFVGFESATALGDEAKKPLRFIPQAVVWSTLLSGLFFILLSYTEVLGFNGYKSPLDKIDTPISALAELAGVQWLGIIISVGITFSFFTCTLASVNAASRILYSMARHGIFHSSVGKAHVKNETPHIAVNLSVILVFLVPATMSLFGIQGVDVFGYLGSIATYGFLLVYILISVAAPVYLHRLGKLRPANVVIAALAILFMLIPVVGSVYPVPPAPYNVFPYLFLVYLVVGGGWFMILRSRSSKIIQDIERDIEAVHKKFSGPKVG